MQFRTDVTGPGEDSLAESDAAVVGGNSLVRVDGEVVMQEQRGGQVGEQSVLKDAAREDHVAELGALGDGEDQVGESVVEAPGGDGWGNAVCEVVEQRVDERGPVGLGAVE